MGTAMKLCVVIFFYCISNIAFSCSDDQFCPPLSQNEQVAVAPAIVAERNFSVYSDALNVADTISMKYTCGGENVSPDIRWRWNNGIPPQVKSYVVLVTSDEWYGVNLGINPRAVDQSHWVVYNIPPTINSLLEGTVINGSNGTELRKYTGPRCNSMTRYKQGKSKYAFTVYALDTVLDSGKIQNKDDVIVAIQNHIIARGTITKFYAVQQNLESRLSR